MTISRGGKTEVVACDYLACGFHLVPNIELPALLGCRIERRFVQVDDFQRTSVQGVFCAGEPTGIGGVELALVEGQIAGLAAGEPNGASAKIVWRAAEGTALRADCWSGRFACAPNCGTAGGGYNRLPLRRCFVFAFAGASIWRAAKLQTRCGMGPCQGRICGPATSFFSTGMPDSVRPPVFPVRVESLANRQAVVSQAIDRVIG